MLHQMVSKKVSYFINKAKMVLKILILSIDLTELK